MKVKGLIIALSLLAVAIAGYFIASWAIDKAEADKEAAKTEGRLLDIAPEDVAKIVYKYQGETYEFVLADDGETWLYPADPDFPLKQRLINEMAEGVEDIISIQLVTENGSASFSQYGLDDPQCVLSLTTVSGESYVYNIGNYSGIPKGYYLNPADSDAIYIVKRDVDCYFLSLFELAVQDSLPYIQTSNARELEITSGGSSFKYSFHEGGIPAFYNSDVEWFLDTEDDTLIGGDITKFREFFSNINALEVHSCAYYPYSEADLSEFGLENGGNTQLKIVYDYEDSDTGEVSSRTYTLQIGDVAPERDGLYTYVHINDSNLICTIKTDNLKQFILAADEDYFMSKDVCVVDYESIWEMQLTVDGVNYDFSSTKENTVDQFGYDVVESTFYLDGQEVNAEYFRVLQSGFSSINVEAFADDGDDYNDVAPYIRIVYTTDTMNGAVLEFVPYNANFYLARFGGRNDMLVNKQDIRTAVSRLENLLESLQPAENEAAAG